MKELKDLVEGDEVLVTGMSHRHIAKGKFSIEVQKFEGFQAL